MVGQRRTRPLLLGDLGGTRARFLLTRETSPPASGFGGEDRINLQVENFDSLEDLLGAALDAYELSRPARVDVVLGIAGPVNGARARFTNLPWTVERDVLREIFGFNRVHLVNDVAAAATALGTHASTDVIVMQPGTPEHALKDGSQRSLLVSVGTGLGTAYWSRPDGRLNVEPAEAGHAGFAPTGAWQVEWLERLQAKHGRASWERVLSGSGLAELDGYLRDGEGDQASTVVQRANAGSTTARRAIRLFSGMLGTFCGDLVLASPASGGVWLTGGVLAGIDYLLDRNAFLEGFHAKGRMGERMNGVAVRWTREEGLGLRGAWLIAVEGADGLPRAVKPVRLERPRH